MSESNEVQGAFRKILSAMNPREHNEAVEAWAREHAANAGEFEPIICVNVVGSRNGKNGVHDMYMVLPWEAAENEQLPRVMEQTAHLCYQQNMKPLMITICTTAAIIDRDDLEPGADVHEVAERLIRDLEQRRAGGALPENFKPAIIVASATLDGRVCARQIDAVCDEQGNKTYFGDGSEVITENEDAEGAGPLPHFFRALKDAVDGKKPQAPVSYVNTSGNTQQVVFTKCDKTPFERNTTPSSN